MVVCRSGTISALAALSGRVARRHAQGGIIKASASVVCSTRGPFILPVALEKQIFY